MQVLHFITSLRTGGAERLMVDLLPRLRAMGFDAELLLLDGTATPMLEEARRRGIPVHALSHGARAMHNPLLLPGLRAFLRSHHYDYIHTHNTPCQLLAALAAPHGSILITTEHNTTNRRRAWRWARPLDSWLYGRYVRVVCVSDSTREALAKWLSDPKLSERLLTISNGVDLSAFVNATPAPDIMKRFAGKVRVAMVASFREQKDHATLLRAAALLPQGYVVLLAGEGATLDSCKAMAEELGVGDTVAFLGNRPDAATVLAAADIAVQCSHWEGHPLGAIEAMAAGKPLVASRVPGLADTVGDGGMLVEHASPQAMADAIAELGSDAELRQRLAEAGRKRAALFDIATMAQSYSKLYD